jgi:hypothetical protein
LQESEAVTTIIAAITTKPSRTATTAKAVRKR